jgi:hypothetical protein
MSCMLEPKVPPVVNLRTRSVVTVVYGFGDASGSGLGSTFTCGSGFTYRIGVWGSDDIGQSSNWKEFCNIVSSLEDEAKEGNLSNSEVFMFTDNSTVEACCVWGTSSSPNFLSLVVQLRSLTTRFGVKISVFHVSGTRMIAQGTDGVSRGFLRGGVIAGEAMTSFIPIHLGATARHPPFVAANIVLEFPAGHPFWPHDMHEPVLIGILFPFLRSRPWQLRTPPKYTRWEAACVACSKTRKWTYGIFRANFGATVAGSESCRRMWCGGCYTSSPHPDFFTADPDNLFSEEGDENRLVTGWRPKATGVATARRGMAMIS